MAQSDLSEFAPAKINLFLHVLGKRDDGYHDIESLAVFANVGDRLTAVPAEAWGLDVCGPFCDDLRTLNISDNLILKAAHLAEEWAHNESLELSPLHFTLEKNLLVASGVGGGSADAGAALRLCSRAAGFAPIQKWYFESAARLGADVPACLLSKPVWMTGTGDDLRSAVVASDYGLVLVNPGVAISTAEVFTRLDGAQRREPIQDRPNFLSVDQLTDFLKGQTNDLETAACGIAPEIGVVLDEIGKTGPLLARMSGSGATCFGLYRSKVAADVAAASLQADHPDWWVAWGS